MDGNQRNRRFQRIPQHLPIDVITEILRYITVRPLGRMRQVNPDWDNLITSGRFGRIHLEQMRLDNRWVYFFATESHYRPIRNDGRHIYYRTDRLDAGEENQLDILCAYSGLLVCITHMDAVFMWNPMNETSAQIHTHPVVCPQFALTERVSFSLGYTAATDDFILVRITLFGGLVPRSEVMMYSRNTQNWTRGPAFPYETIILRSGVYVSGHLHWLVNLGGDVTTIARMNKTTLEYSLIELDDDHLGPFPYTHLESLGEATLCLHSSLTPKPLHFGDRDRTHIFFRVNPIGRFGMVNIVTGAFTHLEDEGMFIEEHVGVIRFLQTLERPSAQFSLT